MRPPPLSGFVVVDKPPGPTSHDVVAVVRRALHQREVGHAGTLDPFASGTLVVLLGSATRLADVVGEQAKSYRAVALLGVETTTDDLTGEVTRHTSHLPGDREVEAGLQSLVGTHAQVPPAYSAKHVQGRRAYALARAGEAVDLPAAPVTIHAVTLLARQGPRVTFDVRCGRGTYIRAMARDLGRVLGVGAHLVELRRTAVGPFRAEDGVAPERVAPEACRSPEVLARALPHAEVAGHQARDILHGKDVTAAVVGTLPWAAGSSGVVVGPGGEPLALARANHALAAGDPVAPGTLTLGRRFPSS